MAMVICSGCNRHVRESVCPFCGATTHQTAPARSAAHGSRAALALGVATAVTVTLAACSSSSTSNSTDAGPEAKDSGQDTSIVAAYGGPVFEDSGVDASPSAAYGGPIFEDSGSDAGTD